MPVSAYSTTPASNNGSPPNGAPEGMSPSSVNDTIRQIMADIRTFYDDVTLGAVKSALTTRASTTTLAADPDLTLSLTAGTYELTGFLAVGNIVGADTNGFKFDYSYSGTVSAGWFSADGVINGSAAATSGAVAYNTARTYSEVQVFAAALSDYLVLSGVVKVSNSGTFALRWAQNTSKTQGTTVDAGSWIRLRRLA